jgi:adenine-specific DNA methylase
MRTFNYSIENFPNTRYQGSKRKLLNWIWENVNDIHFDSCLDLFSGTSSVSYLFKTQGKSVTSNDKLKFNSVIARALVQNNHIQFNFDGIDQLLSRQREREYKFFITETFDGVFYPCEENRWLDVVVQNISFDLEGFERDIAFFALYQACLAKRPYNLFHRANLYMRTSKVKRSFGNKATWDKAFREHFVAALVEANGAVFDNGRQHRVISKDFREVDGQFDLVYMDPPYINTKGTGVDYLDFYHFLEGITEYDKWPSRLTTNYKHLPYKRDVDNMWNDKSKILNAFNEAIDLFKDSIIVISYRNDGIPSVDDINQSLMRHGRHRVVIKTIDQKYALSTTRNKEVLLISEP